MIWQNRLDPGISKVNGDDFSQNIPEVGGVEQVASLMKLTLIEAGPAGENRFHNAS